MNYGGAFDFRFGVLTKYLRKSKMFIGAKVFGLIYSGLAGGEENR